MIVTAAWTLLLLLTLAPEKPLDSCALALWAVGQAPKPDQLDIEVLALQERATLPARQVFHDPDSTIWLRPLPNGEFALALINRSSRPVSPDVVWNELGILKERGDSPRLRDVLTRENLGKVHGGFSRRLDPGQCAIYRVKP